MSGCMAGNGCKLPSHPSTHIPSELIQSSFVIEGMGVVILAILSFFFIHDFPSTASFLTPEERAWALYRLKYQNYHGTGRNVPEADCFHWDFVKAAYKDWHVWVGVLVSSPHKFAIPQTDILSLVDVLGYHLPALRPLSVPPLDPQTTRT